MTDLQRARAMAENIATSVVTLPGGFVASFSSAPEAQAYLSSISRLNVDAAVAPATVVTVTEKAS